MFDNTHALRSITSSIVADDQLKQKVAASSRNSTLAPSYSQNALPQGK